MKLCNIVEVITNNEDCVILKLKENCEMKLIEFGGFDLLDYLFRLTKGKNHTCTIFKKNGESFSWYWGRDGYTLVSYEKEKMGKLIERCIVDDFGIYMGDDYEKIKQTMNIRTLEDKSVCTHKDNEKLFIGE